MKVKLGFLSILLFFVSFLLVSANVEIGEGETTIDGVEIVFPKPPAFMNNTGSVNKSQFAEIWVTNEGDKDNVADISTSELTDDNTYAEITGDAFTGNVAINFADFSIRNSAPATTLICADATADCVIGGAGGLSVTLGLTDLVQTQIWDTLTVGIDDEGEDVKFHGDTEGNQWKYNAGLNKVELIGDMDISFGDLDMSANGNVIKNIGDIGTDFTATGGLNLADDLTLGDDVELGLGNAQEFTMTFNGSDTLINPQAVGAGSIFILGDIIAENDVSIGSNLTVGDSVGVGTENPSSRFHLAGTTTDHYAQIDTGVDFDFVGTPDQPAADLILTAGNVDAGEHFYFVSYTTVLGETNINTGTPRISVTTDGTHEQVTVTLPVSTDYRVTGRKIYRTKAGGNYYNTFLLATIANNVDTTYVDNIADASLTGTSGDGYFDFDTTNSFILVNGVQSITIAEGGTALGYNAKSGRGSVSIGHHAGESLTTDSGNVLIGQYAGSDISGSGGRNTFVGHQAGLSKTTQTGNTGIGRSSLIRNGGTYNTAVGSDSGGYTTGSYNAILGEGAGEGTSGQSTYSDCVLIGREAGEELTTGTDNTFIGYQAGDDVTTGSSNILIGHGIDATGVGASNELNIGDVLKGSLTSGSENLSFPHDRNFYFGEDNDAYIGWDGTNLVINTNVSGGEGASSGLAWFSHNLSAAGYVTRTSVYDKTQGDALDKIMDADDYLSAGVIDHSEFYGYTTYEVTDWDSCGQVYQYTTYCWNVTEQPDEVYNFEVEISEECGQVLPKGMVENYHEDIYKTVCGTKIEEGVILNSEIDVLRQAVYELKTELCNHDATYSWCSVSVEL